MEIVQSLNKRKYVIVLHIPAGYQVSYLPTGKSYHNAVWGFDCSYEQKGDLLILTQEFDNDHLQLKNDQFADWNKVLENLTVHPSGDDWFKFIQGLNTAKVYKWAPTYYYPGQGPAWVIDFAMEDRTFKSEGTNEYPKNGDESHPAADPKAGPTIPFDLFWQAVLGLVGKIQPPPPPK